MIRVLLTGMSGTGKSRVILELAERGYKAVDTDSDAWCVWTKASDGPDWVWREDRMRHLLATEDADVLFVSGCKSNQGKFYPQFDHVILLSAPVPVMIERIADRMDNDYGKRPEELAEILGYRETVEPLLRRGASLEVDTDAPIEEVIATILDHVLPPETRSDERPRV